MTTASFAIEMTSTPIQPAAVRQAVDPARQGNLDIGGTGGKGRGCQARY